MTGIFQEQIAAAIGRVEAIQRGKPLLGPLNDVIVELRKAATTHGEWETAKAALVAFFDQRNRNRDLPAGQFRNMLDQAEHVPLRSNGHMGDVNANASPNGRAAEAPSPNTASIPFMVTSVMKQRLRDLGHTDDKIHEMTPAEAWALLSPAGIGGDANQMSGDRRAPEPEPEAKPKPRDVNDILRQQGEDAVRDAFDKAVINDAVPSSPAQRNESGKGPSKRNATAIAAALAGIKTATTLQTMKFPLLKYVVPGLLVEGCVLLAGKPKAGKSWFSYDVALAVGSGRFCLGDKKCEQGGVLYLALEDNDRRLQDRATKLLPTFGDKWPERFEYQTQWPRADEGGIEAIDQWCEAHPEARLVVIDVLAAFRAPSTNKTNAYDQDYAAVSQLQKLAARRAIAIIIVHHTRKGASEDPVEEISGTLGLGGGVDAFLILKRKGSTGTLIGRGRDIEDHDLGLLFSKETCRWTILGEAADVQRSEQQARVLVALDGANEGLSTSEIISLAHLVSRGSADVLLSKMVNDGQIERVKRGVYGLPGTTTSKVSKIDKITKKEKKYEENPTKHHTSDLSPQSNTSKPDHSAALEFLTWALTPGRRLVRDIEAQARTEGLLGERQRINNSNSLQDAKRTLKVVVEREGFGSQVYWRLPEHEQEPAAQIDGDPAPQAPEPEGGQ